MKNIKEKVLKENLGVCQRCKKNKATIVFSESVLNYTHGFSEKICQRCFNKMQMKHPLYKLAKKQTLAEVGKVIEKRLNVLNKKLEMETSKAPKHSSRRLSILYSAIDELNLIKQKLGIEQGKYK